MTMLRYVALGMFCLTLMAVLKKNTESSGSVVTLEGHSRSLGETSVSLFNTLGLIDPEVTMLAIIIIVAAVLALETIFHMLNEVTRDTTFHRMVGAIEKELMLVGCTAFIFKIIVNAEIHVEEEWLIALEYSDLLVPLFAFANCFIGIWLIFLALRQCDVWSKGFHLQLSTILDDFDKLKNRQVYKYSLKPMYSVVSEMEFRIFHGIFCENFKVQRSAFAFDTYVELVFEKFILEIIKIRPINWVLVILLLLLNIARSNSKLYFFKCEEEDYLCIQRSAVIVFTICGGILLVVTIFVSLISRRYEILIIKKSGVASIERYPQYLRELEAMSDFKHEAARLNKEELKMAVNASRKRQKSMRRRQPTMMDYMSNPSILLNTAANVGRVARRRSTRRRTGIVMPEFHEEDEVPANVAPKLKPTLSTITENQQSELMDRSGESGKMGSAAVGVSPVNCSAEQKTDNGELDLNKLTNIGDFAVEAESQTGGGGGGDPVSAFAAVEGGRESPILPPDSPVGGPLSGAALDHLKSTSSEAPPPIGFVKGDFEPEDIAPADLNVSRSEKMESARRYTSYKLNRLVPLTASQASNFLETIFMFSSPMLYFEVVRLLIMLIALYMALWVLNFLGSDISGGWKFLSILPAMLSCVNYFYIVKTSSLLRAIYKIDEEAVLEVLENSEGSRLLGLEIREKLLKKLDIMSNGDPRAELRALFNEIDDNGSNRLSRSEFEALMRKMDIHFSRKKWKKIFHQMDFNFDDKISFEEFINFLFPGENNFATDFVSKRVVDEAQDWRN